MTHDETMMPRLNRIYEVRDGMVRQCLPKRDASLPQTSPVDL
jgi:hypothetical protein